MKNIKKINDFLSIKENINNDVLGKLANEISALETEDGVIDFDISEFNIDGIQFFVTGVVEYIEKTDKGNYNIPPSKSKEFYDADLEIFWNDGTMDEDLPLSDKQINYIIKKL